MVTFTDDAIFFGLKFCEDLQAYGALIAEKHKKKFGGEAPRIASVDLTQAHQEDLLPKEENYERWLRGFQATPENRRRWWQKVKKVA
ncbi:hypothetical protein [Pseudomonas silesiensis]